MTMTTAPHQYTSVQLLQTRDEAAQYCYDHIAWLDTSAKKSVKCVHSDNAKELVLKRRTLKKMGTAHTTTSVLVPESNGDGRANE